MVKHEWEQRYTGIYICYYCWRCEWTEQIPLDGACPGPQSRQPTDGPQIPVGEVA